MRRFFRLIVLVAILAMCTIGVLAASGAALLSNMDIDGTMIAGENVTLRANDRIDDDVVLFGGNLTMEPDSSINGDLAMFGGNALVDGKINGEIAVTGGNLQLGRQAVVAGDIGIFGGNVKRDPQAQVQGRVHVVGGHGDDFERNQEARNNNDDTVSAHPPPPPERPNPRNWDDDDDQQRFDRYDYDYDHDRSPGVLGSIFGFIINLIKTGIVLLAIAAVSWLVAAMLPEQMKLVGDTLIATPIVSFGVGLSTFIVAGIVGVVLLITICLAPISFLGWFLLGVAKLFGWIVLGQLIGERLIVAMDRPLPNFTTSTLVGVLVLTALSQLSSLIGGMWLIGGLLSFLATMLTAILAWTGLGAVILTRFGTQPYPAEGPKPFFSGGNRPRTRWPDPDLDLNKEPSDSPKNEVDLDKSDKA